MFEKHNLYGNATFLWKVFLLLLFSFYGVTVTAQYTSLTARISLEKKIKLNKKWRISLKQQLQITPETEYIELDFNEVDNLLEEEEENMVLTAVEKEVLKLNFRGITSVALEYRFSSKWKIKNAYNYYTRPGTNVQTMNTDLVYAPRLKVRKLAPEIKLRFQQVGRFNSKKEFQHRSYGVAEMKIRWKGKILRPYLRSRITYRIRENRSKFDRLRGGLGLDVKLGRSHTLQFDYSLQRKLNTNNPDGSGRGSIIYKYAL